MNYRAMPCHADDIAKHEAKNHKSIPQHMSMTPEV